MVFNILFDNQIVPVVEPQIFPVLRVVKLVRQGANITNSTNPIMIIGNITLTVLDCYAPPPVRLAATCTAICSFFSSCSNRHWIWSSSPFCESNLWKLLKIELNDKIVWNNNCPYLRQKFMKKTNPHLYSHLFQLWVLYSQLNQTHCPKSLHLSNLILLVSAHLLFSCDTNDLVINFLNSQIYLDLYKI